MVQFSCNDMSRCYSQQLCTHMVSTSPTFELGQPITDLDSRRKICYEFRLDVLVVQNDVDKKCCGRGGGGEEEEEEEEVEKKKRKSRQRKRRTRRRKSRRGRGDEDEQEEE